MKSINSQLGMNNKSSKNGIVNFTGVIHDNSEDKANRGFTTLYFNCMPIAKGDIIVVGTPDKNYVCALILVTEVQEFNQGRLWELKKYEVLGGCTLESDITVEKIRKAFFSEDKK